MIELLGEIEVRRRGGKRPRLRGSFPYGTLATVRDRGRVRKETIASRAFAFAIEDRDREINLLLGHSFGAPLASRRAAGNLEIEDTAEAVRFEATLPEEARQPTWMRDAVLAIEAGLVSGVSPGFSVPPKGVVPDAERFVPEPGNPGVHIREIHQAVLFELSAVTRPAYNGTSIEARAWREYEAETRGRMGRVAGSSALGGDSRAFGNRRRIWL